MSIVVTGGVGFIGGEIVRQLVNSYRENVIIIDKITEVSHPQQLDYLSASKVGLIQKDISDPSTWKNLPPIEGVINCAAESHVDRSIENGSFPFIQSNIIGTHNALEFCKLKNIRLLQVSTDEIYGSTDTALDETAPRHAGNPYSATKLAAEALCESYFNTFKTNVVITRGSNTYGPWQYPEKVIPLMISKAYQDKNLPVYGDGSNVRQWLHVKDHANGIIQAFKIGVSGEVYNLGGDFHIKNLALVKTILKGMNKSESLISFVEDRKGHDFRYWISSKKSKDKLNWEPKVDFNEGLHNTIQWYLKAFETKLIRG